MSSLHPRVDLCLVGVASLVLSACQGSGGGAGGIPGGQGGAGGAGAQSSQAGTSGGGTNGGGFSGAAGGMTGTAGQSSQGGIAAGAGTSAGGISGGGGGQPPGTAAMFIAMGAMGRITMSCDDGLTWKINQSWDLDGDPMACGMKRPMSCSGECWWYQGRDGSCTHQTQCDCMHNVGNGRALVFGNGYILAGWGWGHPGPLRRSRNGIDWEDMVPVNSAAMNEYGGFASMAFGAGYFVEVPWAPHFSTDGQTWTKGGCIISQGGCPKGVPGFQSAVVRRFAFANHDGGRFVAVADGEVVVSKDHGLSWTRPPFPAGCFGGVWPSGGIAYGAGAIVVTSLGGQSCRSLDGGSTWTVSQTGSNNINSMLWTGTEFMAWDSDSVYRSPDGAKWTKTAMTGGGLWNGKVGMSDKGTFVAIGDFWGGYAGQYFKRSTDGINWTSLPRTAFTASHPIYEIEFGYGEASALCPASP